MTSEAHSERRVRVRRMESLRDRLCRRNRDKKFMNDVRSILEKSRLSCSERGRILGACLCMMEEVRLTRRLMAEVRV